MAPRRVARSRLAAAAADPGLAFRESKLRLFGVALTCAFVALVPLVFDHGADWPFTVPKALLTHSLAYALAGVMAGLVIRFGRDVLMWSWLHVPVLAFLAANVAATIFAEDRLLALYGTHARMLGLATFAAWTVLYFGVVTVVRTHKDIVALVVAGLGAAIVMLAYELAQLLQLDPFSWNTNAAVRPFSTNGQATSLAAFFTALAVSTFAATIAAHGLPRWARVVLLFFSAGLLTGAAATGTRSALIGLATGSATLVLLVWLKHPSHRARFISAAAAAAAALGLALLLTVTPIGNRILQASALTGDDEGENLAQLDLSSFDVRTVLYRVAIDVVRERPLLGYGPDNFVVGLTRHRPESGPDEARLSYATSAHSWIAQIAVGSGLIGLTAFVAIIAGVAVLSAQRGFHAVSVVTASGLASYLGTGLTSVSDVGSDWFFWVGAALLVGSSVRMSHTADVSRSAGRPSRSKRAGRASGAAWPGGALAALFAALGIALALTSVRAMDASRAARLSQDNRLEGRVGDAQVAGLAATIADPGRAEYWHRLGLAYVGGARWRDAASALDRAVRLAPWDTRYISDLVQTQLLLARDGDGSALGRAEQLADEGVRRDPNYPPAHLTRAIVFQATGDIPEAVRSVERALALNPQSISGQVYVTAAQLYVAASRPLDAVRMARARLTYIGFTRSSIPLRIELARALLITGDQQGALAELDAALSIDPNNAPARGLRSQILSGVAP